MQMCWLPSLGGNSEKILHLKVTSKSPWVPYTSLRQYAVPDYRIARGSKGWATYQKLRQCGWKLVPTASVLQSQSQVA
jgi:hypothetical protein